MEQIYLDENNKFLVVGFADTDNLKKINDSLGHDEGDVAIIATAEAIKNVLPALANEFIVLLKETSVACYVAVTDLTKGGEIIRGATYIQAMPLFAVAAIYLIMVIFFSKFSILLIIEVSKLLADCV